MDINIDLPNKSMWANANELLLNVFENILINAVKYNENSVVEINVKISKHVYRNINYLKIEIKDNGTGIPDDRKQVIFERNYKKISILKGWVLDYQ